MGNLGLYQDIIVEAHKVGGPANYKVALMVKGGVIALAGAYLLYSQYRQLQKILNREVPGAGIPTPGPDDATDAPGAVAMTTTAPIVRIVRDGTDPETGVVLAAGREIQILEDAGDAVLVNLTVGEEDPAILSRTFLDEVSGKPEGASDKSEQEDGENE